MKTNETPFFDSSINTTGCCPKFNPEGWDGRELHFEDKGFVRATTKSAMHVPLNMGRVFTRVQRNIEDAAALPDPSQTLSLSHELSPWEAEHFFAVSRDVDGEEMASLSGDFVTRVFEGSFSKMKDWEHELQLAAKALGKEPGRSFMFYTTCPGCAKVYGQNYVVGVVEVSEA